MKLSLLFVVVAVGLPCVLGHCCWPDRFTSMNYISGDPVPRKFVVDFKMNRYLYIPMGHKHVDFALHDQANAKAYVKYKDGRCAVRNRETTLKQCLSDKMQSQGVSVLAGGSLVESFIYKTLEGSVFNMVTKSGCIPVLTALTTATKNQINVYTNVSVSTTDPDYSKLSPDLSNCKHKDNVHG